jgi:hypothetical protein
LKNNKEVKLSENDGFDTAVMVDGESQVPEKQTTLKPRISDSLLLDNYLTN